MIGVMGASGNTGQKIARALLDAGETVRALGRSEASLAELKAAGAEVLAGDTTDVAVLAQGFRGMDAVYALLPTDRRSPDYPAQQAREGEAIVTAIRQSGVPYVRQVFFAATGQRRTGCASSSCRRWITWTSSGKAKLHDSPIMYWRCAATV